MKIKICNENNIEDVIDFVKDIDNQFPIKLSTLVNIKEYIYKLFLNGKIIFAEIENKIIGICAGYMNDEINKNAFISILGTDLNYRKQGIATKMLELYTEECKRKSMKRIFLETYKENNSALKFYNKEGFIILKDKKANIKDSICLMKEI